MRQSLFLILRGKITKVCYSVTFEPGLLSLKVMGILARMGSSGFLNFSNRTRRRASSPVSAKSSEGELTDFLAGVIPDYDRDRVYLSDIKKLASWYGIISKHRPYVAAESSAETESSEAADADAPKAKKAKAPKATEPAADEPLSTGGVIGAEDAAPAAEGNPEAAAPAKKPRKKAE